MTRGLFVGAISLIFGSASEDVEYDIFVISY